MDYDSDQYNGLTDKENMTAWDDEVNGTTLSLNAIEPSTLGSAQIDE